MAGTNAASAADASPPSAVVTAAAWRARTATQTAPTTATDAEVQVVEMATVDATIASPIAAGQPPVISRVALAGSRGDTQASEPTAAVSAIQGRRSTTGAATATAASRCSTAVPRTSTTRSRRQPPATMRRVAAMAQARATVPMARASSGSGPNQDGTRMATAAIGTNRRPTTSTSSAAGRVARRQNGSSDVARAASSSSTARTGTASSATSSGLCGPTTSSVPVAAVTGVRPASTERRSRAAETTSTARASRVVVSVTDHPACHPASSRSRSTANVGAAPTEATTSGRWTAATARTAR
jgi:hypothetical protein